MKNHQDGEASADPIGSFLYVYMIVVDFFFFAIGIFHVDRLFWVKSFWLMVVVLPDDEDSPQLNMQQKFQQNGYHQVKFCDIM